MFDWEYDIALHEMQGNEASFPGEVYVSWDFYLRCWRICVVCLALKLTGSWVVVGFSVGMEAFGRSLIT